VHSGSAAGVGAVLVVDGVPGVAGAVTEGGPDGGTEPADEGFSVSLQAAAEVATAIASKQLLTSRDVFRIGQVLHAAGTGGNAAAAYVTHRLMFRERSRSQRRRSMDATSFKAGRTALTGAAVATTFDGGCEQGGYCPQPTAGRPT
jgi:hypothetical protein